MNKKKTSALNEAAKSDKSVKTVSKKISTLNCAEHWEICEEPFLWFKKALENNV